MSGFSYPQPIFISDTYNPSFYLSLDQTGYLTYAYAQTLYISRNDYRLSYLTGISDGTATPNLALVPASDGSITGLGALSCSSLTVGGSAVVAPPSYVVGITAGTAANNKALVLGASGQIGTIASLTATSITGTLQTAAQTNITSLGTLTNLTLSTTGTGLFCPNIQIYNATTSLYDNFDHSQYVSTLQGGCVAQKALIVDLNKDLSGIRNLTCSGAFTASTSISSPSITTDTIAKVGTQTMTATTLNINPTTLQLRGTTISATATELNVLAGVVAGTASNSKALILGSTGNISGIGTLSATTLSATTLTGTLSTAAQTNITSLGSLASLRVNYASSDGYLTMKGDGTSFLDGASTRFMFLRGANATPVMFQIDVHNGSSATSDNSTWVGNYSSNDFILGTNAVSRLTIKGGANAGRVGVGTISPVCGLHVATFASQSMTGPLATGTSSAYLVNQSGTYTDSTSIYCEQALMVGVRGMYVGSDRRVKENIITIPPEDGTRFVQEIDPKFYKLKGTDRNQVGYISQDFMQDYGALITLMPNKDMVIEQEGDIDGAFMSLSYERVPAFLHACLKDVLDRLDEQQSQINELRSLLSD